MGKKETQERRKGKQEMTTKMSMIKVCDVQICKCHYKTIILFNCYILLLIKS